MNKHANLIAQLKQHARIGMPDPTEKGKNEEISKATDVFKDLNTNTIETTKSMTELEAATKTVANQMKAIKEAMPTVNTLMVEFGKVVSKSTGANMGLSRGLGLIIAQQRLYHNTIIANVKAQTYLEQSNKSLANKFNLNREAAAKFMYVLREQATNLGIGDEKLANYASSLDGLAHGFINAETANSDYVKNMMIGQTVMQNQLGLSELEAQKFESFSAGLNMTSADNLAGIKQIADQLSNSSAFAGVDSLQMQKDIIADIADLTEDVQMQYSRYPAGLAKATQYAKKLGLTMAQLHRSGEAFLNIEQSIGQELEYQLISGQRLLTDQGTSLTNEYRMATIKGDGLKQAQLMSRFLEDQGETLENNMYARKKAAELFGIDEAQLSKSIQKQKILNSLGATNLVEMSNGDMESVYKKLAEGGASEGQINELKGAMDTRSTDEIATDHLAKIEANTSNNIVGSAENASSLVTKASTESLALAKSYDDLIQMFDDANFAQVIGQAKNMAESVATLKSPFDKLATGIPGLEKVVTGLNEAVKKLANVSILGGEAPVLASEKINNDALIMNDGVVQFNKSDKFMKVSDSTMIAGTNVDGNKKLARAITTGGGASIDYNQMAMAIVSAMKSATFVATVKPDLLFNGKKY